MSSAAKRRRRGKKLGRPPRKVPPSLEEGVKGRGVRRKKCRISSPEAPPAATTNAAPPGLIGCNFADCGELFGSLGLLARHLEGVHREASILRCPLCGKYFTQSPPFDLHLAENHTAGRGAEEGGGGGTSALPVMKPNHVIGKRSILTRGNMPCKEGSYRSFFFRKSFETWVWIRIRYGSGFRKVLIRVLH